jgi:3'(2'), 5'-bisphosphate nucleotidase
MATKMDDENPGKYLDRARAIAEEAGRRILTIYGRDFSVDEKQDGSPLTEADQAAHSLIVESLIKLARDIPVLSEESAEISYEERAAWARFWLVDPLDGTKEFINRNGEFTVNIALIEGSMPVLGVVHVPVAKITYYACLGGGAFKQREGKAPTPIRARSFGGGKPMVAASRSHAGDQLAVFLKNIGDHDVVSMGSALKLCLVAEGAADVYPRLGPTMEWDTAAAQCVVEQAGGRVTDLSGAPLTYNKKSLLNSWFLVGGRDDYDWLAHLPNAAAE